MPASGPAGMAPLADLWITSLEITDTTVFVGATFAPWILSPPLGHLAAGA